MKKLILIALPLLVTACAEVPYNVLATPSYPYYAPKTTYYPPKPTQYNYNYHAPNPNTYPNQPNYNYHHDNGKHKGQHKNKHHHHDD